MLPSAVLVGAGVDGTGRAAFEPILGCVSFPIVVTARSVFSTVLFPLLPWQF